MPTYRITRRDLERARRVLSLGPEFYRVEDVLAAERIVLNHESGATLSRAPKEFCPRPRRKVLSAADRRSNRLLELCDRIRRS